MSDIVDALLLLQSREEVEAFIRDLMTPAEIKAFRERWQIVQLLDKGENYRAISAATGASVTTVTRVARFLKDEPYQGYRLVLDRLKTDRK